MQEKLISIIIPTYNRSNFLKEAIKSVLNQTYQNYELIVIDDGSPDDTNNIVKSYNDPRIKYIYIKHSGSPALVRNVGIKCAKGNFIAFLDSDDLWISNKLEIQIKEFLKHKGAMLISSNRVVFPYSKIRKSLMLKNHKFITFSELIKENLIYTSSVIIRREVIEDIGLFDEDVRLRSGQDYDYWLRIMNYRQNSILILKYRLIKYRVHNSSITSKKIKEKNYFQNSKEKVLYYLSKYTEKYPKLYLETLWEEFYDLIIQKYTLDLFRNNLPISKIINNRILKLKDKILILFKFIKIYFDKKLNRKVVYHDSF